MPDISCLLFTLYLPIASALLRLLQPGCIPREVLHDLAAAVNLRERAGAVGKRSEIERFIYGIARESLRVYVALAFQNTEVGAVHNDKGAVSTREDVEASAAETIRLISLSNRLTKTEVGKELLKDVHTLCFNYIDAADTGRRCRLFFFFLGRILGNSISKKQM